MKRFLAGMLALVLVVTSLYYAPVTEVRAMTQSDWLAQDNQYTTTAQYQGLNFNTLQYNYYFAEKTLNQLPATFEATVRVSTEPYRAGMILSNSQYGDGKDVNETGTFSFGFYKGMIPFLYIDNNENGNGVFYKFDKHGLIGVNSEGKETISGHGANTTYGDFHAKNREDDWVHLAIVNDAEKQTITCYVDGTPYTTATGSDGSTYFDATNWVMSKAMALGSDYRSGNTQQFIGDIKNVAVYADAREEEEIKADCEAMKVENANYSPIADENLMACYALDFDVATGFYPKTLEDLSTNSYDMVTYDWLTSDDMEEKNLTISRDDYSYSMAVIGDPQCLPSTKDRVETLFQWVKDNAEAKNIKFAFQMGDSVDSSKYTTDSGETTIRQNWKNSSDALKLLNGTVPYSFVRGNHDSIALYNEYYPYADYKESLSGSYDDNMLNTYQKFEVGDIKYLVLNLDFGVGADSQYFAVDENDDRIMSDGSGNPDKVLAWANDVVKANPGYNVILTTHGYTDVDGSRLQHTTNSTTGAPTNSNPSKEGYQRAYSGEDIYENLVKDNSNIVLVLSGHIGTEYIKQRTVTREDGSNVVEMLVNPQTTDQYLDDTGLVAMMYFNEANTETNKQDVTIQYYATLRDRYYLTENQNIKITLDVIDDTIIENKDGSVVIAYDGVIVGKDTVSAPEDYKDYLFAGWYTDASCTTAITNKAKVTEHSYAQFWPKDLLDVKVQITNGIVTGETSEATQKYNGNYVIRFVSSLQNLNPVQAGFTLHKKNDDGSLTYVGKSTSTKAFKGIESTSAGSKYNFSPKVISELSEWFITAKMPVAPADKDTDYVVRAYWTTADGTTVYGDSRCVSVMDHNVLKSEGEQHTLNLTVNGELDKNRTDYTASFVSSYDNSGTTDDFTVSGAAVEVLNAEDGYSNVRITLPAGSVISNMASLTRVTIDDTDSYGMYRYYNTSHVNLDNDGKDVVLAPHADTSWYYASEDRSKFVIASSADLYGLANLVNAKTHYFEGELITLVGDVEVNKGTSWQNAEASSINSAYVWKPIGTSTSVIFKGTFDGDGNSVSGLYTVNRASGGNYTNSNGYVGFFGSTANGSVVKNLAVTNSYFDNYSNYTAGVIGYSISQTVESLFSDAVLVGDGMVGGIIGREVGPSSTLANAPGVAMKISNCWYDGNITTGSSGRYVGGIVGQFMYDFDGEIFENCLFTGKIDSSASTHASPYVGGILGSHNSSAASYKDRPLTFKNCIVAGEIIGKQNFSGEVVGSVGRLKTISIVNCYSVCDLKYMNNNVAVVLTSDYAVIDTNTNATQWTEWTITDTSVLNNLITSDGIWTTVEGKDVPVLEEFAHTWQKLNNNN